MSFDPDAGIVSVDCPEEDGVKTAVYFTDTAWTGHRSDNAAGDAPLTHGEFALTGRESFVRVEVIDRAGRRAWGQTVKVKEG